MDGSFISTSVHVTGAFKLHPTSIPSLQRDVTTFAATSEPQEATGVLFHRKMRQHHAEGVHGGAEQSLRTQDIKNANTLAPKHEATWTTFRRHG